MRGGAEGDEHHAQPLLDDLRPAAPHDFAKTTARAVAAHRVTHAFATGHERHSGGLAGTGLGDQQTVRAAHRTAAFLQPGKIRRGAQPTGGRDAARTAVDS